MMQLLARWLGEDLCEDRGGETWRLLYGDLARWNENEGGCRSGSMIHFEIGLGDHIGDFDIEGHWDTTTRKYVKEPLRQFLSRWISIQIGRWGISFTWRGREITGTDWWTPRWHYGKDGKLLPDWAE